MIQSKFKCCLYRMKRNCEMENLYYSIEIVNHFCLKNLVNQKAGLLWARKIPTSQVVGNWFLQKNSQVHIFLSLKIIFIQVPHYPCIDIKSKLLYSRSDMFNFMIDSNKHLEVFLSKREVLCLKKCMQIRH